MGEDSFEGEKNRVQASPDWYKSFFSGLAVEMWQQATLSEATGPQVDFLRAKLQVAAPARLLDVPCGGGRHANALAAQGFSVTGVDISSEFLDLARSQATAPVQWELRDMVDLPW